MSPTPLPHTHTLTHTHTHSHSHSHTLTLTHTHTQTHTHTHTLTLTHTHTHTHILSHTLTHTHHMPTPLVCDCNGYNPICNTQNGTCDCLDIGVTGDGCDTCNANSLYTGDPDNICFCESATAGSLYCILVRCLHSLRVGVSQISSLSSQARTHSHSLFVSSQTFFKLGLSTRLASPSKVPRPSTSPRPPA